MIGAGCDLHTEVERKTRFLMAGIVPGRTAGESVGVRLAMFSPLPAGARVSVTHDNGAGFARHTRLRDGLGMDTYFADPYSSRRRGSNENRNGMIRRYLPKRSEIQMGMAGELRGDCRRGRQPSHARAGLPDARRGIRRRTARIAGPTGVLHL